VLKTPLPQGVNLLGFANHTLVIARGKSCNEREVMTNTVLSAVAAEIDAIGLLLATEKTEAVLFRRKYTDIVPRLFLNDTQIAMKRCIKYLGIQVDDNLYFNEHFKMFG